jgi:PAB-dependent poly(A)-specific ribonuclease subunit 3
MSNNFFPALIFVYDYFPSADTLMQRHFERNNQINGYVDPFSSDPSVPRPYSHQKNALLRHHASKFRLRNIYI